MAGMAGMAGMGLAGASEAMGTNKNPIVMTFVSGWFG